MRRQQESGIVLLLNGLELFVWYAVELLQSSFHFLARYGVHAAVCVGGNLTGCLCAQAEAKLVQNVRSEYETQF